LLIKYINSVLWGVAKRLSYTEDARCLKVKEASNLEESNGSFGDLKKNAQAEASFNEKRDTVASLQS